MLKYMFFSSNKRVLLRQFIYIDSRVTAQMDVLKARNNN